jgi:hypothetical protein
MLFYLINRIAPKSIWNELPRSGGQQTTRWPHPARDRRIFWLEISLFATNMARESHIKSQCSLRTKIVVLPYKMLHLTSVLNSVRKIIINLVVQKLPLECWWNCPLIDQQDGSKSCIQFFYSGTSYFYALYQSLR